MFDDLVFDEEGPGDLLILSKLGLGIGEKFTLLGGGLAVMVGIFILTKSSPVTSIFLEGICKMRFCLIWSEPEGISSLISVESSTYKKTKLNRINKKLSYNMYHI